MSFFGGGTDFKQYFEQSRFGYGSTISTALNMYVYITVNKRFDDKIRIIYTGNELVDTVDEVKHDIIRNALKIVGIEKGIEVIYSADIPLSSTGIGLASSSALAVGVLNALHCYQNEHISHAQLAREACHIELDCIGQQIGIQDQYAVSFGGFRNYKFYANGSVSEEPVICKKENIKKLKDNLMLFYTGQTRDSRKIMSEQSDTISEKMKYLDDMVESVERSYSFLNNGDVDQWGYELDKTWSIKKTFAVGVTNPLIDDMYFKAKNAGALGGKILGAGGGGFLLLYVQKEKQGDVQEVLCNYRKVDFDFDPLGTRIVYID